MVALSFASMVFAVDANQAPAAAPAAGEMKTEEEKDDSRSGEQRQEASLPLGLQIIHRFEA